MKVKWERNSSQSFLKQGIEYGEDGVDEMMDLLRLLLKYTVIKEL